MARRIPLSCDLEPTLAQALDAYLASRPGESRSSIVREALAEFLRRHAKGPHEAEELDALDLELAREARRRMADADDEVVPYEQARAESRL